jgi:hypothetical protein
MLPPHHKKNSNEQLKMKLDIALRQNSNQSANMVVNMEFHTALEDLKMAPNFEQEGGQ